uniref:Uncharacterized protein n=1 Tax=Knipowitschia caucasica TaxID=637954 RepID=A0AAV2IUM8_KNICA
MKYEESLLRAKEVLALLKAEVHRRRAIVANTKLPTVKQIRETSCIWRFAEDGTDRDARPPLRPSFSPKLHFVPQQ